MAGAQAMAQKWHSTRTCTQRLAFRAFAAIRPANLLNPIIKGISHNGCATYFFDH